MSIVDDIIQVKIELSNPPIIVGLDHDKFKARLLELGHEYFNNNKTYAILFDTTPPELIISEMKNYKDITEAFPNDRVFGKACYIGNYREEDRMSLIEKILTSWGFEIIEVVI